MYKKRQQMILEDFILPFEGELDPSNRWIQLAAIIPWGKIERKYAALFKGNVGNVAKPARLALGALIIKEKCGFTDRETVQQIRENPYLQYFLGLKEFSTDVPFDASLMVHFRKRFSAEIINDINKLTTLEPPSDSDDEQNKEDDNGDGPPPANDTTNSDEGASSSEESSTGNKGTLILDATCAPADIRYPTDLALLNEAREKLESIIDTLYEPVKGEMKKPRTYRRIARKQYLAAAKQRRLSRNKLRKALRKQLGYVKRNLNSISMLLQKQSVELLSPRQREQLEVIRELYRQQKYMFDHKTRSVENRIVSISQPHVRPIKRGKAGASVEFGAKVAISLVNGYSYLERLSWDNFNEGSTLIDSAERYKKTYGCYPKVVLADTIYRNRKNLQFCKKWGIRLSGPRLGRPPVREQKLEKRQAQQDARNRNSVEGKIGEGKRAYGLGRIRTRLANTSETAISLQFLVMNLERRLRILLAHFYRRLFYGLWRPFAVSLAR